MYFLCFFVLYFFLGSIINIFFLFFFKENKKRRKANDNGQQPLKKVKRPSSVDSSSSDLESQEPDMQTIEERIDFLSDAFTAFSREVGQCCCYVALL